MSRHAINVESRRQNVTGGHRNAAPVCEQDSNVYIPSGPNELTIQRSFDIVVGYRMLDIGELAARLERLENAVDRCTSVLTALSNKTTMSSTPTPDSAVGFERDEEDMQAVHTIQNGALTTDEERIVDTDGGYRSQNKDDRKRHYRATSMESLFSSIHNSIDKCLKCYTQSTDPMEDHIYNELLKTNQLWMDQFNDKSLTADLSDDGLPPTPPSKELLDSLTDVYFRQVNTILPVLSRERFYGHLYSISEIQDDSAWVIISNNLTIQSLYQVVRLAVQGSEQLVPMAMHKEVVQPFLENARRAFAHIKSLHSPRLINVQAITSLFLIAMDHFQMETADVLLEQACRLALDAGIHHENNGTFIYSPAEIKERRGLFWTLFVLDKNWSLIKGRNPFIPLQTCSIPFLTPDTTNEADNVLEKYFLVRIRLAMIQEQIYLDLYSSQGKRRQHTLDTITVLDNLLQQWYKEHTALLDVSLLNGPQSALALEILFHYQNSRILVLSCVDEWSCRAACVNLSRESIMILQNLNQSRGIEKHSALHRGLQLVPFAGFTELVQSILNSVGQQDAPITSLKSDCDLLRSAVEIIENITSPESPNTYGFKLHSTASRCLDLVSNIVSYAESRSTMAIGSTTEVVTPKNRKQKFEPQMVKPLETFNSNNIYDMFDDFDMTYDPSTQTIVPSTATFPFLS
ncbi:hypothetical protein UA08_08746 [Talaromyces atroroseus]|uniref:Xylanolytic transcriptional activator regulatory domain-containing protein n=1 Tax=Talaromyces atroroseus TaxID=1441469 RepID=A0A225AKT3_TALAT|nr:hypothetical protein UA08_08746 [Talaromyces atroroseus]OKL56139.1 hypothetical protein UA08_08746 [Talaromyces atroroseus]